MTHFISAGSKEIILTFYDLLLQSTIRPYFLPNLAIHLVFTYLSGKKDVK